MFIKLSDNAIFRKTAEHEGILINMVTREKVTVNETGFFFLSYVDDTLQDSEEIVTKLSQQISDVSTDIIRNDFMEFMTALKMENMVEMDENKDNMTYYPLKHLHIEITMECNERCIHCYLPNKLKSKGDQLSFSDFCKIVDEFVTLGGDDITLSGGEPLKHPDFIKMLDYCNSKNLVINILSNLTLMNDELIAKLRDYNIGTIQTSIYSLKPAIHDSITLKKDSLTKTITALEKLYKNGFTLQIACPVFAENFGETESLIKYAQKKDILLKINGMLLPQIDGNTDFKTKSTLNQNQKQMLLRSLLENKNQYTNEQLSRCSTKSNDLCKNPALYLEQPVCSAGIDNCSISSTGQVYPCTEWTGFKIGDINLNSLKEIWERSEQLKQLRAINKRKNYKKCLSCEALDYCKVCLMLNQAENCGEILRISKNTCNEAFMTKDVLEKTR